MRSLFFAAIAGFLGLAVFNTLAPHASHQLPDAPPPAALAKAFAHYDVHAAALRLQQMIQVPSISFEAGLVHDPQTFLRLHALFQELYPNLHRVLKRETVNNYTLLYTWEGTESGELPICLLSHMDVVPADESSLAQWIAPPFSGEIVDGFIYGRGAQDVKVTTLCFMEAIETLIQNGFKPRRTIYLSIGHDEEVGGEDGAVKVVELLKSRGVTLDVVLDEGGVAIVNSTLAPERSLALVGISEKGHVNIEVSITHNGACHAAMPEAPTPAARLATAIVNLERNQMRARLDNFIITTDFLLAEMPWYLRAIFVNRRLLGPILPWALSFDPKINAFLRTTTATTMMSGSSKRNVIPTRPAANINMRIIPGDTVQSVLEHVQNVVGPDAQAAVVTLEPYGEATPVSSIDGPQFAALHKSIREAMPDALVAPSIVVARTDSAHFADIAKHIFRYLPFRMSDADVNRIHGQNERMHIDHLFEGIKFFHQFIVNSASPHS